MNIDEILKRISMSKFRNSFHLNKKMKKYVQEKGYDTIRSHAYDFINTRIRPEVINNDGKQTPMRQVHPVFIAQHACACCCRKCLEKWYHIKNNKELTNEEVDFIVNLLIAWIKKEMGNIN